MIHVHGAVVVMAWVIAWAWVVRLVEVGAGLRKVPNLLRPEFDRMPESEPAVVVIVPARNEAEDVGACLESLVGQDYAKLRIIAVDDRSTDGTGAIMDAVAAAHGGRLEVLHVEALPQGWLGKTHAMAMAARQATAKHAPEYLLFTDGDVVFRRDVVRRALARALAVKADHFVVLPTTLVKTRGEGMVLAYLQTMALTAYRIWRVEDSRAKRDVIGVGAFNLIRTAAYEGLGGFEATPMEILEDLTLGRRVKRAGLRQSVAAAPGMVCLHWAAGVSGILRGMTKNVFAVFRFRPELLLAAAMAMVAGCVAPVAFLLLPGTRMAGMVALGAVAGLYVVVGRTNGISPMYAALFPVSAVLVVYTMLWSMAVTMRQGGVDWRGTFYSLAELREHVNRGAGRGVKEGHEGGKA